MLRRIALILNISPGEVRGSGLMRITNADTRGALAVQRGSFLLTLEWEPNATFTRGHLRLLGDSVRYPIQSNTALFEALKDYIARSETMP
jgi:hypothetical protein